MDIRDPGFAYCFLQHAVPEAVFTWLKDHHQPHVANDAFRWRQRLPKDFQRALILRKERIIDLGLAAWGDDWLTARTIYQRYCSPSVRESHWPPAEYTEAYSFLSALLASPCAINVLFNLGWDDELAKSAAIPDGMSKQDFDKLLLQCGPELLKLIHTNPASGFQLLESCAIREGAFGNMSDERWLEIVAHLFRNPELTRAGETDPENPDLRHWETHELFVQAIAIAPKTDYGASRVWGWLIDFPNAATKDASPQNLGKL